MLEGLELMVRGRKFTLARESGHLVTISPNGTKLWGVGSADELQEIFLAIYGHLDSVGEMAPPPNPMQLVTTSPAKTLEN